MSEQDRTSNPVTAEARRIALALIARMNAEEAAKTDGGDPLAAPEPLSDRLDREAKGRGPRSLVFAVSFVAASVLFVFMALRELYFALPHPVFAPDGSVSVQAQGNVSEALLLTLFAAFFAGCTYLMVRRPHKQHTLRMLAAKPAQPSQVSVTREALHDMSLASGVSPTPALYVIETPAINAVIVGDESDRPVVAVTQGLAHSFTRDEQRAVMAHLIARMRIGKAPSAEGAAGYEEQADALAMQTLRDPRALLSALERSRGLVTELRMHASGAFEGYAFLPFFGGLGSHPALHERRIARLRAVVGAEGSAR